VSGIPFHNTRMGQRFYESTMPELVRELSRFNGNLEQLIPLLKSLAESKVPKASSNEEPQ
jgi:hypothetical protein